MTNQCLNFDKRKSLSLIYDDTSPSIKQNKIKCLKILEKKEIIIN